MAAHIRDAIRLWLLWSQFDISSFHPTERSTARGTMQKGFREKSFGDRLSEGAKAKQAQLERARAKSPANDPEFAGRQEGRRLAQLARTAREEERRKAKLAALEEAAAEKK